MSAQSQKEAAASYAAGLVEDGMAVGLGSGTTAEIAVRHLGRRCGEGLRIIGVPTSEATAALARSLDIPLATLEERGHLDLVIDGADEVDGRLNLIKGHGGALLREKLVAMAGDRFIVVADDSKRVGRLGEHTSLPVEVVQFGWTTTQRRLERLGFECGLRGGEKPFVTDGHNYVLDCTLPASRDLADPSTADAIKAQVGVVEHGLFLSIATTAVIGVGDGEVVVLSPERSGP